MATPRIQPKNRKLTKAEQNAYIEATKEKEQADALEVKNLARDVMQMAIRIYGYIEGRDWIDHLEDEANVAKKGKGGVHIEWLGIDVHRAFLNEAQWRLKQLTDIYDKVDAEEYGEIISRHFKKIELKKVR